MRLAKTKHFAKSLVEIGREQNCFDSLISDLENVEQKFNENLDFLKYVTSKQVELKKKKLALKEVFQDFISERTYNFILLLIKSNKVKYLNTITEQAKTMNRKHDDVMEIIIESVIPLEQDQVEEIKQIISKKIKSTIIATNIIKPELLGGMRIIIGDMIIEGSIFGKIMRLKQNIDNID